MEPYSIMVTGASELPSCISAYTACENEQVNVMLNNRNNICLMASSFNWNLAFLVNSTTKLQID